MTHTACLADPRTKSLVVPIELQGAPFSFKLLTRPLDLGAYGTIQYYWMNSADFRVPLRKRAKDLANFRNCVGHWWQAMASRGLATDPVQVGHLLLATAFGLFSSNKALQKVYRDAHLKSGLTTPELMSLPDELTERIQAVVASKDREQVREELDGLFGGPRIQPGDKALIGRVFMGIMDEGVRWYQEKGKDGFEEFLGKLEAWSAKWRKEGRQDWRRSLLNLIAYECKVSFNRCYSNVWIDLIPWLRKHQGLDKLSERFLRIWHMQNQPHELSDGTVLPDVFGGQILSLHPLSGFFMKDSALLAVAGRFLGSRGYNAVMVRGEVDRCQDYWDLMEAILTAAHLYRQALENQEQLRGLRRPKGMNPAIAQFSHEERSHNQVLEDFLACAKRRCSACGQDLRVNSFLPPDSDQKSFDVDCTCSACALEVCLHITRKALEEYAQTSS